MRLVRLSASILLIIMISMTVIPVGMKTVETPFPAYEFSVSEEITGVPYVWQEVNGFCFPSALSMVLQSMGMDIGLYDILAASGAGFSMISISIGETMTFFPGVMVRQLPWIEFYTDLYGLDYQFYLDSSTDYGLDALQTAVQAWGGEVNDYAESTLSTPSE